ncbi:MAG: hypothetical protein IPK03_09585 [Bacteroidetes bacterium]|nr:hypothetical protein [Bacteroidota bacterium]
MKQIYFLISIFFFIISCKTVEHKVSSLYKPSRSLPTDEPAAMFSWEYERVKNPITGDASKQHLVDIYNQIQEANKYGSRAAVPDVIWKERGPNNIGGRTRTIIFDLKDTTKKRVFAASVGGGLFRCDNIDSTIPTWNKINDFFSNLAVTTIAQNPTFPDTIYFGTGEGFLNADAIGGAGVWRTADNGQTWVQLPSIMNGSVPFRINRMAVTKKGVVYAATNLGLYKSINGGNTWITELRTTGTAPTVASNTGFDVKVAQNDDVYYACSTQVWRYSNVAKTWTNVSPPGSFARIEIGCAPSDSNFVYLLCQGNSGSAAVTGFFSSNSRGGTWRSRAIPLVYDQAATATTELSRGQAWYDLCIAVDPLTPTTVYAGGIEYIKSIDTGATYKQITAWSLFAIPGASNITSNQAMHSDHHALVFKPGSNSFALFGGDGGIYRSLNMQLVWPSLPTYKAINNNYNVTQFYSCAIANVQASNNMLGGAQDNGSLKYNAPSVNAVVEVTGGDGCYTFIDQNNSNNQITSYVRNNYF